MKKNNNIYKILGVLVVVIAVVFLFLANSKVSDAVKFKKEYEALNGTIRESDGEKYNSISIDKDNPIKYINCKKALDVLDKDEAIIYVGAEWCPWCRNAVPVLFEVAKDYNVDTIYYLNLDDEKSNYEVKDGKLVKTTKGSDSYYKLLEKLSDRLEDYTLKDEDGNVINTNEKRIYMPYVIGIKDGSVVSDKVGTISLEEEQTKYSEFTKEQRNELKEIYSNLFTSVYGKNSNICQEGETCD